ncbi:cellulase family glycosylhydrolase [Nitrosovibrio tenuis]|uniref:Cellulase (Glycosyl hydrolase family 5) n=1 Tax=Nitrosovibrio tenuis TaxID=1233 RepID=A0A1H7IRD1_9PROT|nr:cellulase family glycosylhydrolase [Nitrosovibrio tenuis]SEK64170.1 Cellulase (glycosyl hydrolase family 5) [Nitrosovibrio tenuis]
MTDFVIDGAGKIPAYPTKHYGAHFTGSRATFCLDADFACLDANVLAIPNLPVTVLSASPVKAEETFFGMSVQNRANDSLVGVMAKTTRSHDLKSGTAQWKYIEISKDVFNWSNVDSWVNTHYGAGRHLIFTLFGTPTWASARPAEVGAFGPTYRGLHAEPANMGDWDAFCAAVATRYLGKIKYYEIWNEPNYDNNGTVTTGPNFYFSGRFTKLAEMVRRANQAIKAIDPTAKIICPATTTWSATAGQSAETYFSGMMSASDGAGKTMKDWVDIIGVHLYLPGRNKVQDLAGIIDRLNSAKVAAGVSEMETWDTESAPIGGDVISLTDMQAQQIIGRMLITMAAKGIARTLYYQYDHGTMGIADRPQIAAYREQIISLLRSGIILTVSRFSDGRVAYYTNSGLTII